MQEEKIQWLLDREEIFDLVRRERHYRDIKNWQSLLESYVPAAPVRTTWFEGPIEKFVEASRRKNECDRSNSQRAQALDFSNVT
jgi:hypothetical protein